MLSNMNILDSACMLLSAFCLLTFLYCGFQSYFYYCNYKVYLKSILW